MVYMSICCFYIFFFKQKTAYEMRISDWSSDVCSSDLSSPAIASAPVWAPVTPGDRSTARLIRLVSMMVRPTVDGARTVFVEHQIGRASCRERVCQYV